MDIRSTMWDSEKKIKDVQKQADAEIKELHKAVLLKSVELFRSLGWNQWGEHQLMEDGQFPKVQKALKDRMQFVSIDYELQRGRVQGSSVYEVNGSGCTCKDFAIKGLPCKHMYFLAVQLTEGETK